MRVTQNSSAYNALYNIQQQRSRLDSLQESISSGQKVNRPSDDPIANGVLLDLGDRLTAIDQYTSNISKADTWVKFTDTALTGMSDIMTQTQKLIGTINSGSSDPSMRQSAHDQLVDLKKQIIDMANTQLGDQYIFGGANGNVPPFSQKTGDLTSAGANVANIDVTGLKVGMQVSGTGIQANTAISAVTVGPPSSITLSNPASATATASTLNIYAGDSTQLTIEIASKTTQALSLTGDRLLKGTGTLPSYGSTDILQTFDNLIAAVGDKNNPSILQGTTGLTQSAVDLQAGFTQITNAVGDNLGRMTRLDNMAKLNDNNKNMMQTIVGNIQNVDYAQLGVELNNQQTAFNASLSATAKISKMSLLDYM